MVTTTSAPFTASAADAAFLAPFSTATPRAAADKSKAVTWCWPLTRFAAIGPPMLPRPMKAIFAMSSSLSIEEQVVRDRLEVRLDHLARHALDGRRVPFRLLVLVDQERAHALEEIMIGPHAVLRHAVLDGHRVLEGSVGATLELLQRDRHRQRRQLQERGELLLRPFAGLLPELGHDVADGVRRETAIDVGHQGRQRGHAGICREARDHGIDLAVGVGAGEIGRAEGCLQLGYPGTWHM